MLRFILVTFFLFNFTGFSQKTKTSSFSEEEPAKAREKVVQEKADPYFWEDRSIYNRNSYSLESFTTGLFLRPEIYNLNSLFINAYGTGFNFKYYPFRNNIYIFSGMQYMRYDTPETGRVNNIGLNAGMGYDLNPNTQIKGRLFHSLFNSVDTDAFQPVQLTPLQPISLGIKTKF